MPHVQGRDLKLDEVEQMLWDAGFSEFLTKAGVLKFSKNSEVDRPVEGELRELLAQGKRYSAEEGMAAAGTLDLTWCGSSAS